jgi:thymidine kinase
MSQPTSEICYGPMKSGKSRHLIAQAEAMATQSRAFLAFKPRQDTRDGCFIRSRDPGSRSVEALVINQAQEILEYVTLYQAHPQRFRTRLEGLCPQPDTLTLSEALTGLSPLVACLIDEVFLLDSALIEVMNSLIAQGISVYLSGLDRDFRCEYFPLRDYAEQGLTMQQVIQACQKSYLLTAACEECGEEAPYTLRLINGLPAPYHSPTILIGDEEYQARCQTHHALASQPIYAVQAKAFA